MRNAQRHAQWTYTYSRNKEPETKKNRPFLGGRFGRVCGRWRFSSSWESSQLANIRIADEPLKFYHRCASAVGFNFSSPSLSHSVRAAPI